MVKLWWRPLNCIAFSILELCVLKGEVNFLFFFSFFPQFDSCTLPQLQGCNRFFFFFCPVVHPTLRFSVFWCFHLRKLNWKLSWSAWNAILALLDSDYPLQIKLVICNGQNTVWKTCFFSTGRSPSTLNRSSVHYSYRAFFKSQKQHYKLKCKQHIISHTHALACVYYKTDFLCHR